MAKTKEQKQHILRRLSDNIQRQTAIALVNFKGLGVRDMTKVRKDLKEQGAELVVAKKTLLGKALAEKGIDINLKELEGQLAAVFAYEEPVATIKTTDTFSKSYKHLQIIGGYFEKQVQGMEQMKTIAALPSREELLGRLVGSIASPMTGFMNVLQGNTKGLVIVLNAISEKKANN